MRWNFRRVALRKYDRLIKRQEKNGNYIKDITKDGTRVLTEPSGELHKSNTRIFISWKKD